MKVRQWQCLCAVVDADFNISRAAGTLGATQPAVGKQLRQLEEELGSDLLVRRRGRAVGLTDAGERTLTWARRALQCADNIRAIAREGSGEDGGTITLATSHTHANHLLLPALLKFRARFARVGVSVVQGTPDQIATLVRDGHVEAGIAHLPADLPDDVVAVPFLTSARLLVAPSGHPLLQEPRLTLEALAAFPIILPRSTRPQGARIVQAFEKAGLAVNVVVQALDAEVIKTYAAAGLGVGIVPDFCFRDGEGGLHGRDASHLFEPAISAVLLRKRSHVRKYTYHLIANLHPSLRARRLEALVHGTG